MPPRRTKAADLARPNTCEEACAACTHPMEANRDAAETAVVRAEAALREQDFVKALRLLIKAKGLYPLDNLDAKIRAVSAKVPPPADEEHASTPVPPGDGDALARKRARAEEGAEPGSKRPAAAASESPAGTDISAATTADAGAEAGAPAEPPSPEYDWQTSGHEWIGTFVARTFGKRTAVGRITKWVPPRADTYAPGRPQGTYGLRVPASRFGYVPGAQGGLRPGPHVPVRTAQRGSAGAAAVLSAVYHPRWHPTGRTARCSTWTTWTATRRTWRTTR